MTPEDQLLNPEPEDDVLRDMQKYDRAFRDCARQRLADGEPYDGYARLGFPATREERDRLRTEERLIAEGLLKRDFPAPDLTLFKTGPQHEERLLQQLLRRQGWDA